MQSCILLFSLTDNIDRLAQKQPGLSAEIAVGYNFDVAEFSDTKYSDFIYNQSVFPVDNKKIY